MDLSNSLEYAGQVGGQPGLGHSLSSQMDGHQFYVGLLMANLSDLPVPGTDRCFGDFAEPFWDMVMFFPALGLCLSAVLQGAPWPTNCDGEHEALHLLGTCGKLIDAGYTRLFMGMVEPLTDAIKRSSPDVNQEADALSRRIGR